MSGISNKTSSEGIYKSLSLSDKSSQNKEKPIENSQEKVIAISKDKVDIAKEGKSISVISLEHEPDTKVLNEIKDALISGKKVNIKYSDFPGMTQTDVVHALFPDAKLTKTKAEHPFFDADYSSKSVGNIHLNELTGGIISSKGYTLQISEKQTKDLPIDLKPFPSADKEKIELKPFPKENEEIKIGDKPTAKQEKYINNKLTELKDKGKAYIENIEMGTNDTNFQINKMFPGAKIEESTYERPFVNTNFTDKDGNKYHVENLVDGFIASRGITITKL